MKCQSPQRPDEVEGLESSARREQGVTKDVSAQRNESQEPTLLSLQSLYQEME